MPKFVKLEEGALTLNTSTASIHVTACNYRKKNGKYPKWYSSNGKVGTRKSYIDVEYLLNIHKEEMKMYHENTDLYFYISENTGLSNCKIAEYISSASELYPSKNSWVTYMTRGLFLEPTIRFHENVTRLKEFNRIVKKMKDEYESHNNLHAS